MNLGADNALKVFDQKAITTATVYSDAIKFEDVGGANDAGGMSFDIRVDEDFTTSDVGALVFGIQDSADGTTYATVVSSKSFAVAALKASSGGKPTLSMALPKGLRKWVRLAAVLTNNMTAGSISAYLNTAK